METEQPSLWGPGQGMSNASACSWEQLARLDEKK